MSETASEWLFQPKGPIFYWEGQWREIEDVHLPGDEARETPVTWDARINLRDTRRRSGQPRPPYPTYTPAEVEALLADLLADRHRPSGG